MQVFAIRSKLDHKFIVPDYVDEDGTRVFLAWPTREEAQVGLEYHFEARTDADLWEIVELTKPVLNPSAPYTVVDLVNDSWGVAEEKGFHEGQDNGRDTTLKRLCLIHTEVSEAAQIVKRKWPSFRPGSSEREYAQIGSMEGLRADLAEELADVMIRIGDLALCCGIDGVQLARAIVAKHNKNLGRPKYYGTTKEES